MPSRFLEADQVRRYAEQRYDFSRKALAGRVVLLPGGAGGLGAAITALRLQDGALPVVGYLSARCRARAVIVLFSSMQGTHPFEGSLAYAGPKAAITHAARILAKEYGGETDIRVNVVAPGATTAGMARASIESGKYDRYVERGVIPRFGRPEDVAKVVRLLLEPDSYITGQVITVV